MTLRDVRRAAVLGLGRSGKATAGALAMHGVEVVAFDAKNPAADGFELVSHWDGVIPDGFDLIVPSPGVHKDHPALLDAVSKGVAIWSEPELAYRIAKAPIWAVTGTNGKSTTTAMLHRIAVAAGFKAHLCGNIAGRGMGMPITTAAMRANPLDVLVAEISSFQLEWVTEFRPRLAILTNVTADHLERYGGVEDYKRTKERIFAAQSPADIAIVGDASVSTGAGRRIGFNSAEIDRDDLRVPGEFNVLNALAASAGAREMGIPQCDISAGLRSFTGLPHRMEVVSRIDGVTYVDNSSCTNPNSAKSTLVGLTEPTIALVGGYDKGLDLAPLLEGIESLQKPPVIYGAVAERIGRALAGIPHEKAPGLEQAFRMAHARSSSGDTILLIPACSSFDAYSGFEERADHFHRLVSALSPEGVLV